MSSLLRREFVPTVLSGLRGRLGDEEPAGSVPVTEVELFDILADNRRRTAIRHLARTDDQRWCPTGDLAEAIASAELHMPADSVPRERVDEVTAELEEVHLPRLAAVGLLRWDEAEAVVAPGPSITPVADWLARVDRHLEPTVPKRRPYRVETSPRHA